MRTDSPRSYRPQDRGHRSVVSRLLVATAVVATILTAPGAPNVLSLIPRRQSPAPQRRRLSPRRR